VQCARKMTALRGIGANGAWLLAMEFFSWRDLRNRRQIGALAGLTPTPHSSGEQGREQGISKTGNRHIRSLAIEIAWAWLRLQPRSQLSEWYQQCFGSGGPRLRRIGIVALARKLLIALWRWTEQDLLPEGAELRASAWIIERWDQKLRAGGACRTFAGLPSGCRVQQQRVLHLVVAQDRESGDCYLVTVYPPDPALWEPDFRTRRSS
jgi:hypothetical protein